MNDRRSYEITLTVNGKEINEVVIDPHYETNHPDINDDLILEIVTHLDGKEFLHQEIDEEWEYFMLDRILHKDKFYRLVWCMKDNCLFIGVINYFRRSK